MVGHSQDNAVLGQSGYEISATKTSSNIQNMASTFQAPDEQHQSEKTFNDSIHGFISFHPLCVAIIDTLQFQRLRNIKQLGGGYFLFAGASHNRFEHSLGVCHLAGELIRALKTRQPELGITNGDELCVQIAGLCHDLGHGPFSHLFDGKFIPQVLPDRNWKHEECSCQMLDHLIKENNLTPLFHKYGLKTHHINMIKDMINRPKESSTESQGGVSSKSFLYEIVSNSRNSIDVDKWDYFARDCHHLGIGNNFDYTRLLKYASVIDVNGATQICYREKEVLNLYDMFYTRLTLHRKAYQHKLPRVTEFMITEAFVKANEHIRIPGSDSDTKTYKMSECIDNMAAFTNLTDHVFYQILYSCDPKLHESRDILRNIRERKLYRYVGCTARELKVEYSKEDLTRELASLSGLETDDIVLELVTMDYGCGHDNPIDNVSFYNKSDPNKAYKISKRDVSLLLPDKFHEQFFLLYVRKDDHYPASKRALDIINKEKISQIHPKL